MPKLLAVTGKFIKSVTFIGYEEGKATVYQILLTYKQ